MLNSEAITLGENWRLSPADENEPAGRNGDLCTQIPSGPMFVTRSSDEQTHGGFLSRRMLTLRFRGRLRLASEAGGELGKVSVGSKAGGSSAGSTEGASCERARPAENFHAQRRPGDGAVSLLPSGNDFR